MKIAYFLIEPWQEKILRENFLDSELQIFSQPLNRENIEKITDTDIIVSRARFIDLKLNRETLEKLPNLKFIATMSTGFDHIDLDYCRQKNILVSNVPAYGSVSVVEQTFALLLAISRKIPQAANALKDNPTNQSNLIGFDLDEKTLGVIGSGKIGLNVIKIAKSFGMNVLVHDIIKNHQAAEELGFKYVELSELLQNSDIITLHTFLNKDSFHLISEKELSLLKQDAIIINTARGGLIDTRALINYLQSNPLAFAGLDVFEGESTDFKVNKYLQELSSVDNVIITPHNASNTKEAKEKILQTTIGNIKEFINEKQINVV